MLHSMPKKDTTQFHIRPPREVLNRLEELARRFKRDSANQVAVEVLRDYSELWASAEQAKYDTILAQQEAVTRAIKAESLRRPIHRGETETVRAPTERKAKR